MVQLVNKEKTLDEIDETIRKAVKSYLKVISDPIKNVPGDVEKEQAKDALAAIDMLDKKAFKRYLRNCGVAVVTKGKICEVSCEEMCEAFRDLRGWGKKGRVPKKVRKALGNKK